MSKDGGADVKLESLTLSVVTPTSNIFTLAFPIMAHQIPITFLSPCVIDYYMRNYMILFNSVYNTSC